MLRRDLPNEEQGRGSGEVGVFLANLLYAKNRSVNSAYIWQTDDATSLKGSRKTSNFRNVTFKQDFFPPAERGSGSGLHGVGAMQSGEDGEEFLTVLHEDTTEPAADTVSDSTVDSFVPATEDAPETEALHTLTLTYSGAHVTSFSDADYATNKVDRKSVAGYYFNYGSVAISWSSKKQTCVPTSSTEAELHTPSKATKEALLLQTILETLGRPASATLMFDLQSSLALVRRVKGSSEAKHFATRLTFGRDVLQDETWGIKLGFVHTADSQADRFTKGLGKAKTQQHLQQLTAKRECQNDI